MRLNPMIHVESYCTLKKSSRCIAVVSLLFKQGETSLMELAMLIDRVRKVRSKYCLWYKGAGITIQISKYGAWKKCETSR